MFSDANNFQMFHVSGLKSNAYLSTFLNDFSKYNNTKY